MWRIGTKIMLMHTVINYCVRLHPIDHPKVAENFKKCDQIPIDHESLKLLKNYALRYIPQRFPTSGYKGAILHAPFFIKNSNNIKAPLSNLICTHHTVQHE